MCTGTAPGFNPCALRVICWCIKSEKQSADAIRDTSLTSQSQTSISKRAFKFNLCRYTAVLAAVNSALAGGMAWDDLEQMIREERWGLFNLNAV